MLLLVTFFLSIPAQHLSQPKSSQEPLPGIILQLNNNFPLLCVLPLSWSKNTPGLCAFDLQQPFQLH